MQPHEASDPPGLRSELRRGAPRLQAGRGGLFRGVPWGGAQCGISGLRFGSYLLDPERFSAPLSTSERQAWFDRYVDQP